METVPPPGDLMLQFEFQSTVLLTLPQDCSLKKNSCEVLIFNLKFWKKHNVYIYIYVCVCVFSTLSQSLSTRHCCNGRADGRCASTNQSNDGLMSFHRWDRLVTSGNTTSRGRVFRPHSLQSFRHFLRIEVQTCLFSKKKRGRHIKVALFFHGVSMNCPENQVVGTWNDAIPRISQNAFQPINFCQLYDKFSRFHI